MSKRIIQTLLFLFLIFLLICISACEKTYSGKVVDADTKEPTEGAVVVISWLKERATVAGPDTNFYDAKETLTDKKGVWVIEGHKGNCDKMLPSALQIIGISCIRKPSFIVYKPGYCPWPRAYKIEACKEMTKTYNLEINENIGEIVELPKLINKEDRLKVIPSPVSGENSWEKQKELIKMINNERKSFGLEETYKYIDAYKK